MRLFLTAAFFVAIGSETAEAVPGVIASGANARACFERVYDGEHLARNSTQTVTRIRVSISREPIPGSNGVPPVELLRVELTRRGDSQVRRIIAWCERPFGGTKLDRQRREIPSDGDGARCAITKGDFMSAEEDDSNGHVDIQPEGGGLLARFSPSVRLRTGDKVSVDKGRMLRLGASDRVFRLAKVSTEACDDLRNAIREE